jgi:hypothetical protein
MRSNLEGRVIQLEIALKAMKDRLQAVTDRAAALRQQTQVLAGANYGGGGGAGSNFPLWAITPAAGILAATGAWPTLTPRTFVADIYQQTVGAATLTLVYPGATIYWWYKDPDPGNRLSFVMVNQDSTYTAIVDSCTRVDS